MPSADFDDLIMGGIIGGTEEHLRRARAEIETAHLLPNHAVLYDLAQRYFTITGHPIDAARFPDLLDQSDLPADRRLTLQAEFERLAAATVEEAHFRYALHAIRDTRRDETFTAGLSKSLRTMIGEGGVTEAGYEAARGELSETLSTIDRWFMAESPEGKVHETLGDLWHRYEAAEANEGIDDRMILTGLGEVDRTIVGLRPGENMLVAGYSGHGKTTVLQNIAWHTAVNQGKNVVIFTNENQWTQYQARLINRHTHHRPDEVGIVGGLRMNDVKTGNLTGADRLIYQRVLHDFAHGGYGQLIVVQMPAGASVEWAVNQLERWGDEVNLDLVVLDYIGRCGPITPRRARRDELNDSLNAWKSALVGYRRGHGLPGITGYQVSREAMRRAQMDGHYTLDCLAETSEAERNADMVLSCLRMEDIDGEVRLQFIKNRDGALMEPTSFTADFATTYIASEGRGGW